MIMSYHAASEPEDSMKKRIVLLSILLLFLVCILCKREGKAEPWSLGGECGPGLHWSMTDEGELTITGTGKMTDAPWRIDAEEVTKLNMGEGITSICARAFENYTKITEVTLPHTLVQIGKSAFSGCENLRTVSMQENVEKIGEYAFSQCENLEELLMSSGIKKISGFAFHDCYKLKEMRLPEGLEEIGEYAFEDCSSLKSLIIPKSVKKTGKKMIENTTSIREITNLSKLKIELPQWCGDDSFYTNVNWYVNGKKVKILKSGQTAKAKPKVFPIKYKLNGAKVKGKLPKKYTHGKGVQLPRKVTKKGYVFYGWMYDAPRGDLGTNTYSCNPSVGGRVIIMPGLARFRLKNIGKHRIYAYVDLSGACLNNNAQIRYADNKEMTGAKIRDINLDDDRDACGYVKTSALEPGKRYWFQFRGMEDLGLDGEYNVWGPKKSIVVR